MATPVVPATPAKVSWFKKLGQFLGKVLKAVVKDGAVVEETVSPVLSTLFPQWAPLIASADGLATKILQQAAVVETNATAIGAATTGAAKLQAVLDAIGPDIDEWTAAALPGSAKLSTVAKSGLVNAFVAVWNEIDPTDPMAIPGSAPAPAAPVPPAA
jgi:hypothetical protein